MKKILRTCFELLIEKEGQYTKDLYYCYIYFSKHYPDRETSLKEVLYFAKNPTDDIREILRIVDEWDAYLVRKIFEVYCDRKN